MGRGLQVPTGGEGDHPPGHRGERGPHRGAHPHRGVLPGDPGGDHRQPGHPAQPGLHPGEGHRHRLPGNPAQGRRDHPRGGLRGGDPGGGGALPAAGALPLLRGAGGPGRGGGRHPVRQPPVPRPAAAAPDPLRLPGRHGHRGPGAGPAGAAAAKGLGQLPGGPVHPGGGKALQAGPLWEKERGEPSGRPGKIQGKRLVPAGVRPGHSPHRGQGRPDSVPGLPHHGGLRGRRGGTGGGDPRLWGHYGPGGGGLLRPAVRQGPGGAPERAGAEHDRSQKGGGQPETIGGHLRPHRDPPHHEPEGGLPAHREPRGQGEFLRLEKDKLCAGRGRGRQQTGEGQRLGRPRCDGSPAAGHAGRMRKAG